MPPHNNIPLVHLIVQTVSEPVHACLQLIVLLIHLIAICQESREVVVMCSTRNVVGMLVSPAASAVFGGIEVTIEFHSFAWQVLKLGRQPRN